MTYVAGWPKWIADNPDEWARYAEADCNMCGGTGGRHVKAEIDLVEMCDCVNWAEIAEDGWDLD